MAVYTVADLKQPGELSKAIKPAIGAKQHGYEDILTELVTEAITNVMPSSPKNFNPDSIRIVKILGGSIHDSRVVRGMVFGREAEGITKKAIKGKIAVFNCALDVQHTETKGTVLIKSADQMKNFSKGEEKLLESVPFSSLFLLCLL